MITWLPFILNYIPLADDTSRLYLYIRRMILGFTAVLLYFGRYMIVCKRSHWSCNMTLLVKILFCAMVRHVKTNILGNVKQRKMPAQFRRAHYVFVPISAAFSYRKNNKRKLRQLFSSLMYRIQTKTQETANSVGYKPAVSQDSYSARCILAGEELYVTM